MMRTLPQQDGPTVHYRPVADHTPCRPPGRRYLLGVTLVDDAGERRRAMVSLSPDAAQKLSSAVLEANVAGLDRCEVVIYTGGEVRNETTI